MTWPWHCIRSENVCHALTKVLLIHTCVAIVEVLAMACMSTQHTHPLSISDHFLAPWALQLSVAWSESLSPGVETGHFNLSGRLRWPDISLTQTSTWPFIRRRGCVSHLADISGKYEKAQVTAGVTQDIIWPLDFAKRLSYCSTVPNPHICLRFNHFWPKL